MPADFITTIDSDDEYEFPDKNGESSRARAAPAGKAPKLDEDLNPEFQFDFDGLRNAEIDMWGGDELKNSGKTDNEVSKLEPLAGQEADIAAYHRR
jgi:ATP-dependent RNA helicase DDX27